jgi:hypothetical protein
MSGFLSKISQDRKTKAGIGINHAHHEVHEGSSFLVCDVRNVSTTTFKWQITTPDTTTYAHMIFDISGTGEMLAIVTEGSDRTDGTALTAINRRRVGTPAVAGTIITHTPTSGSTDGAIQLLANRSGATAVGSKTIAAGGERGINEYILKPNTKYVVAVTTYADIYVSFCVDWYEHSE